ncbi:sulfurtransferase complex subunit TusD [Salinicola avicenniae]|uniref:sulfurtransferase complex subunit TusD n=1 Tax=Salinicola avicenniae TaxID=2916836 RepID=UPI002072E7A5|nr:MULTISPECIES: sulfurtransferase complex subunit TusD [unclassified Salinicola]
MTYALLVQGAPYTHQAALSALRFGRAVVERGHRLKTVFFYHDGVHNASALMTPPQDEVHLAEGWRSLHRGQGTELLVCVAAGLRRGLLDEGEASRHGQIASNVAPPFELTGLGQLLDAMEHHDRMLTFSP